MFRVGKVVKINPHKATAVVQFFDMDEEVSYELPVVFPRTMGHFLYWMPKVEESVLCGFINETEGFILGSYHHTENPPKQTKPETMHIHVEGNIIIEATGNVIIKGTRIDLNP